MFSSISKPSRWITEIIFRSFSSKRSSYRSISPQLRFHMDTKSVFGPQQTIRESKSLQPSQFDLFNENPKKQIFENDTELLYASSNGFRRACSVPKGIPITERQKYLRHLFRIPRGQRASLFPQAYVPNKFLGLRRKKINKLYSMFRYFLDNIIIIVNNHLMKFRVLVKHEVNGVLKFSTHSRSSDRRSFNLMSVMVN